MTPTIEINIKGDPLQAAAIANFLSAHLLNTGTIAVTYKERNDTEHPSTFLSPKFLKKVFKPFRSIHAKINVN